MAEVIVRVDGKDVVHPYRYNSDAYHYAAECAAQGFRAHVRPDPEVGMGATLHYPQDAYPYVISRVSPSGKTIWVKRLDTVSTATGHEPAYFEGPFPVWHHEYTAAERVAFLRASTDEYMVRKGKYGWGGKKDFTIGKAIYHRNFSY